jgi:hypothetical protein
MPLFKARVTVTRYIDIPVYAENESDAIAYMNKSKDWENAECFDECGNFSFSGKVFQVQQPYDCDFDGDELCWNAEAHEGFEELFAATAFYNLSWPFEIPPKSRSKKDRIEADEINERNVEEYFRKEEDLIFRFNDTERDK